MSFQLRDGHRVFAFTEAIDFRAGFDKLSMLVRERMKKDLVEGDLFLFLGKNRKRLKALCYDGTGLMLLAKRLESGRFMSVAELEDDELSVDELNLLLSGGIIRKKVFGEKALQRNRPALNLQYGPSGEGTRYRGTAPVYDLAADAGEGTLLGEPRA